MDKKLNLDKLLDAKSPKRGVRKDNYLGIEIEFISHKNQLQVARSIFKLGLEDNIELKKDGSIDTWGDCKCDNQVDCFNDCECIRCQEIRECTCGEAEYGHEIAVLVKERDLDDVLSKLSKLFKETKATVNESCGLHVHLDMFHRDKELAFRNLIGAQDLLLGIVNADRRDNTYCSYVKTRKLSLVDASNAHKHKAINANTHFETIEIRAHEGTVNTKEIKNWCELLMSIVDYESEFKFNIEQDKINKVEIYDPKLGGRKLINDIKEGSAEIPSEIITTSTLRYIKKRLKQNKVSLDKVFKKDGDKFIVTAESVV